MTELFQIIADFQGQIPGWCPKEKAVTLAALVLAIRPEVSLEIGVYGGASLFGMALAHKAIQKGIVVGIDPWNTAVAAREQTTEEDRKWWSDLNMTKIHGDFLKLISDHQLDKYTKIIRNESRYVEPPNSIGVLHIDGSHSDTAISDMVRFAPKVCIGGFVVTDDSNWSGGGVSRGEERLKALGFSKRFALGTGAVFQRVS